MYKVEKSGTEEIKYLNQFFFKKSCAKQFSQTSVSDRCKQQQTSRGCKTIMQAHGQLLKYSHPNMAWTGVGLHPD